MLVVIRRRHPHHGSWLVDPFLVGEDAEEIIPLIVRAIFK
jgi:hypothetical protein